MVSDSNTYYLLNGLDLPNVCCGSMINTGGLGRHEGFEWLDVINKEIMRWNGLDLPNVCCGSMINTGGLGRHEGFEWLVVINKEIMRWKCREIVSPPCLGQIICCVVMNVDNVSIFMLLH